jgi:hypothetical protein
MSSVPEMVEKTRTRLSARRPSLGFVEEKIDLALYTFTWHEQSK